MVDSHPYEWKREVSEFKEKFEGQLTPGMQVYWYAGADKSAKEHVAFVVASSPRGILELIVLPALGGGQVSKVNACYHVTHTEALYDAYGRPNNNSRRYGCWDFSPMSKKQYEEMLPEKVEAGPAPSEASEPATEPAKKTPRRQKAS